MMKRCAKLSAFLLLLFGTALSVVAQDEERSASGLPTFIGPRPGPVPAVGSIASVAGTVEIQGYTEQDKSPMLSVAVYGNGTLVSRQVIKNRGGFTFNNVPRYGVTLVVEVDQMEVASYPLGTLSPPPMINRHDILINWQQIERRTKLRNEAISLRNSYQRSEENQKLFEKAIESSKEKKKDDALKQFKQLLEKDADDFVAWTELGNIYFREGKLDEAEKAYNKAMALKPDFPPTLLNLGKLYLELKQPEKSVETLTKAFAAAPASADVNHYLGEAYLQTKKGSKAVVHLNEAIKLEPIEKAELHLRLAALYNAAGVKDRAVAEYRMFLAKVPNHPEKAKIEKYISENSK